MQLKLSLLFKTLLTIPYTPSESINNFKNQVNPLAKTLVLELGIFLILREQCGFYNTSQLDME